MITIQYPPYEPRIRRQDNQEQIWDGIRRKWVALTPEEWVRQHFIQYLLQEKGFPSALVAVEKSIRLGELTRRFDIVIYNHDHQPFLLVECKEMNVPLTPAVLEQALRYNIPLQVPYLVITNGVQCRAFGLGEGRLLELTQVPACSV
jgi:hypothetical protein